MVDYHIFTHVDYVIYYIGLRFRTYCTNLKLKFVHLKWEAGKPSEFNWMSQMTQLWRMHDFAK